MSSGFVLVEGMWQGSFIGATRVLLDAKTLREHPLGSIRSPWLAVLATARSGASSLSRRRDGHARPSQPASAARCQAR